MRRKWMLLATAGVAISGAPAWAQDETAAAADDATLPEIIITAQKRAQNVQDVPIAVTVVTADALESVGGTQLQDVTKLAPGLTITQGDQPANNSIVMRGIGTFAFSVGVEPSVLVVVDDVAVGLQAQGFSDLVDIERVEVLRGPQSTLFGKSASAGVISITTKAPSDRFELHAQGLVTDDDEQRFTVGVSGPLGDVLSFRASASIGRFDGNVKELETGKWINGRNSESYRLKLAFEPTTSFDAVLIGHYNEADQDCCAGVPVIRTPGAVTAGGVTEARYLTGITPGFSNRRVRVDPIPTADSRDKGISLKMNLGLGEHTLTSITAWRDFHLDDYTDFGPGFGPETIPPAPPFMGFRNYFGASQPLGFRQFGSFDSETKSQEVRLTSPSDGALEYILGAYFAFTDNHRRFTRVSFVGGPADWDGRTSSDTYAVFGQAEYEVIPGTRLIGGLRWSHEKIKFRYERFLDIPGFPPFVADGSTSDSVVTGKAGIQQDVGEDVMLFATYSRGYKGGAYDLTSSFVTPMSSPRFPVEPESSDAFEIGMKGTFLDRRLVFNVSAFYVDYSNFQAQTVGPQLGDPFILANVGSIRSKGIEAEWQARVADGFRLNGSVAYTDAEIKDYPAGECWTGQTAAQGCLPIPGTTGRGQDLSGERLANAPEWKLFVAADADIPLGDLPFAGFFNVNYSWQSKVNYSLNQNPRTVQDSYGIFNASIGIAERDDERYKVEFFVRNLFNKHYVTGLVDATNTLAGNPPYPAAPLFEAVNGIPARDSYRYFGVRASLNY